MTPIEVYSDGSSSDNGKPSCYAGWAVVIPDFNGKMFIRYGYLPAPSSNNKAEILGVLYAVQLFHKQNRFKPTIISDSQYVLKSCTTWRHSWAKSNYEGIKNRALLLPLFDFLDASEIKPDLKWVKGHAGIRGNELADEWAGLGKRRTVLNKDDHLSNIKFIPPEELPWDLIAP